MFNTAPCFLSNWPSSRSNARGLRRPLSALRDDAAMPPSILKPPMKTSSQHLYYPIVLSLAGLLLACGGARPSEATLKHKVGQMMMVGFRGTVLEPTNPVIADIREQEIGGIVLYDRDVPSGTSDRNISGPEQLRSLVHALKDANPSPEPLLISIDQEGGLVSRLKEKYGFPVPPPSAQSLGTLDDVPTTAHWADQTAATLKDMGINLNFAPVVDLNVNPDCPVIGRLGRSYGLDPSLVVKHAGVTLDRFRSQGILGCLKHFPGHGSSTTDSHLGFTDVTNTWSEVELEPYRRLMAQGNCDLIMTAHIFNARLDSTYPATLSRSIIQGLLRERLGWQGVVISDDMMMGAITDQWNLETAIEASVNAGVDILIFSNNNTVGFDPEIGAKAVKALLHLVETGRVPQQRIDESFHRVLALKSKL